MQDIQARIYAVLYRVAGLLRGAGLTADIADAIERLAENVQDPCVIAVVGQVSAGKSTLINTLLDAEVALEGMTETTATVTYFRYGRPADPQRPIACHWRDGRREDVDQQFLHRLLGADAHALQLAAEIDHLERLLPSPFLQQITLVDTPGTGSVLAEHRATLDQFLRISQDLEERHTQETRELGSNADAVIYLMGATARGSDRDLVEAFQQHTQGSTRAYNTLGVLSKADISPRVLARREELAADLAASLAKHVNTVVPVSAALEKALRELRRNNRAGLQALIDTLRAIPGPLLRKMLDIPDIYDDPELSGCPVPIERRRSIRASMPWSTFVAIGRIVAEPGTTPAEIEQRLEALAGIHQLRHRLEQHFVRRSAHLRCHKLLHQAAELLSSAAYAERSSRGALAAHERRLLALVDSARGDAQTATELRQLVRRQLSGRAEQIDAALLAANRMIAPLRRRLALDAENFAVLLLLNDASEQFSEAEQRELRVLLGGDDTDARQPWSEQLDRRFLAARQLAWRAASRDTNRIRARVAQHVDDCYGRLLREPAPKG